MHFWESTNCGTRISVSFHQAIVITPAFFWAGYIYIYSQKEKFLKIKSAEIKVFFKIFINQNLTRFLKKIVWFNNVHDDSST